MTTSAVIVTCPGCGNDSCGSWVDCLDKQDKSRPLKAKKPSSYLKKDVESSVDRCVSDRTSVRTPRDDAECREDRTVDSKVKENVQLVRQLKVLLSPKKIVSKEEEKRKLEPASTSESCVCSDPKTIRSLDEGKENTTKACIEPHGEKVEKELRSGPGTSYVLKEAKQHKIIHPLSSKNRYDGQSSPKDDEIEEKDAEEILWQDKENISPQMTSETSLWRYLPNAEGNNKTRNMCFNRKVDGYLEKENSYPDGSRNSPVASFWHYRQLADTEEGRIPSKNSVESSSSDKRNFEDVVDTLRICVDCGKEEVLCCFEEETGPSSEPRSSVLMRLQLVVVETGQQWKRALIR